MNEALHVVELAESMCASGHSRQAEAIIEPALRRHPDEGRLWKLWGITRHRGGNFGTAATALEHASMFVPLSAEDQLVLADCYAHTDRLRHARNVYRHLLWDSACPRELLATIAAGFGQIGDHPSALETCRLAAQRQPERAEPLFGIVFYMRKLGYSAKATIPVMERAVELAADSTLYRLALAFLLSEAGRTEEAYDLVRDTPPERVGCVCQIRRMMGIFQAVGDFDRWSECRQQLDDLSEASRK